MSNTVEKDDQLPTNILVDIVSKKVREEMAVMDMCQCEKCHRDACAIVLNSLEPRYVTSRKGTLFSLLETCRFQFQTDLEVSVLKALKHVKASPKH